MKPARLRAWLACAALVAWPGMHALAHHSFAVFFDQDRSVTVSGVVEEFRFRNPHGLIRIQVRAADGSNVTWKAETNSPSILERRGWKRDTIKAGDVITIEGWPARDGSNYLRVRAMRNKDGRPIGGQAEAASEQK